MGIDTEDTKKNGDEDPDGQPTTAATTRSSATSRPTAPRTAAARRWRHCLTKNPDINVVYTINEPAAVGAYAGLSRPARQEGVLIVSVDGGCDGVEQVKDGVIGATSQQYPLKMAELGVKAIADIADRRGQARRSPTASTSTTPASPWSPTSRPTASSPSTPPRVPSICWG